VKILEILIIKIIDLLFLMKKRVNKDLILSFIDSHIIDYPTPINLSYV
jgi:hypothetical protein